MVQNKIPTSGYFRNGLPYNRSGHGPKPLVIFQGLMFENKPQPGMTFGYGFLEKEYTLYAVLRKAGLPQGYTLKDMADDYAGMIREEFGGPLDVIGVSTGGSIAQHFAADHPDLVSRLVLHSSAHTLSEPARQLQLEVSRWAGQGQVRLAAQSMMDFILPRGAGWKLLAWLTARGMTLGAAHELPDLIITVEAEDRHHFQDRLGEIAAPTLVIAGADDPFYTPALFRETAAGIPNARLVLYEKMRHPAYGKQFARDVLAFLKAEYWRR